MNEEQFNNWLNDNEESIRESFLMSFDQRSLREWIIEDEDRFNDFIETFSNSWEAHLNDLYNQEMDCKEVEE